MRISSVYEMLAGDFWRLAILNLKSIGPRLFEGFEELYIRSMLRVCFMAGIVSIPVLKSQDLKEINAYLSIGCV